MLLLESDEAVGASARQCKRIRQRIGAFVSRIMRRKEVNRESWIPSNRVLAPARLRCCDECADQAPAS